jgi:hypothetical protein
MAPTHRSQAAFQSLDVCRSRNIGGWGSFVEGLIKNELRLSGPQDLARRSFFTGSIDTDYADQDFYTVGLATPTSQVVSFHATVPSTTINTGVVYAIHPHRAATFHPG